MRVREISMVAPVYPDDGPRGPRLVRRIRGISLELVAFVLVTVLMPVLLIAAAVVDLVLWIRRRKPWVGVRLVLFLWWFLLGELRALLVIGGIWLRVGGPFGGDSERRRLSLYNLRISWARMHLAGIRALFGLGFETHGLESAGPGPVVVMIRHASIIDNMVPDAVLAHTHGLGLRYVIKRELSFLPVIDIGGRWVPTNFVRRASGDTEGEVKRLLGLTENLVPGEGILIYPEGTRHTDAKLIRAKQKIAESQPEIAPLADRLQHLLPPRLGGPLALLEETAGTDVVFCAHVGFDGLETVRDVWRGELVGRTIEVRFRRIPGAAVPGDREGRIEWLYRHWQELDDWVGERRAAATATAPVPSA